MNDQGNTNRLSSLVRALDGGTFRPRRLDSASQYGHTILYNSRCLRWLHETELGRPDQAFSGRFLKVATHPEKLQKISCMISRCAGFMLKKLCFLVCSLRIFQQLPELRDVAFLIFIVDFS